MAIFWMRTESGWALNLDGTDAAQTFSLPRIELHAGARGWTCVYHLDNGMSRVVPLGRLPTAAAAMRAGIEGSLLAVGARYQPELRALLEAPA